MALPVHLNGASRAVMCSASVSVCIAFCACKGRSPEDLPTWKPSDHQQTAAESAASAASGVPPGQVPAGQVPAGQELPSTNDGDSVGAGVDASLDGKAQSLSETQLKEASAALWRDMCASCHGARGGGDGDALGTLRGRIADMREATWQNARSDDQLYAAIAKGRGLMPAYQGKIRPLGMRALVEYIRQFEE